MTCKVNSYSLITTMFVRKLTNLKIL